MPKLNLADPRKSLLDHVFENIFSAALNDGEIDELLEKMEKEETPLLDMLDSSPAVGVGCKVRSITM